MSVRAFACLSSIFLLASAAYGQATKSKPAFDIADVHVSPRTNWAKTNLNSMMQAGNLSLGRYELRRATMLDLIKLAYPVEVDKIYGGPAWLDYDRYEVVAKVPPATRPETLKLMLQSLLAERFGLVVKTETKPMPAYVLSVVKGQGKLKTAERTGDPGCTMKVVQPFPNPGIDKIQCNHVTMETFADALYRYWGSTQQRLPVVDGTGLQGNWDIDVQFAPTMNMREPEPGTGFIASIEKQLGVMVTLGTSPQPVLTVQSARQQPSANPPGVAAAFPPVPPPVFEVASVKPTGGYCGITPARVEGGGRVGTPCGPLLSLINQAWNLTQLYEAQGLPKWLADGASREHYFSIQAKAPAGIQDQDSVNLMLRALLLDRFRMKIHYENRPMDALTVTAGKPKLKKANPAGRTGCNRKFQPADGSLIMVCQNITIAQFAEQMPGYYFSIRYPVLDSTGIKGAWDFTLHYSVGLGDQQPMGTLSFFEAIEKQLGLKVVRSKRPEPVLVIDHIEEHPTPN